jgi:hypothetical protein
MSGHQLLIAVLLAAASAAECYAAEPDEIVRCASATLKADWAAHEDYAFIEKDESLKNGQWTARTSQVVFIEGSDYYIPVGSEPAQIRAEAARRAAETPEQRRNRIANYHKARDANDAMIRDFPDAFSFELLGEETIGNGTRGLHPRRMNADTIRVSRNGRSPAAGSEDGRNAYVLAATPKKRSGPLSLAAKVLSGMSGKAWLDKESCHVVRVRGDVVTAVPVYGILAKVLPGTHMEFAMAPVTDSVWLLSELRMNLRISKFFLFHSTQVTRSTYSDYRLNSEVLAALLSE